MGERGTDLPSPDEVARQLVDGLASGTGDAVFGGLNDLILVVGRDGTVEYANPAAEQITGLAHDELVGRTIADLLHPDDVARAADAEARVGTAAASIGVAAPLRLRHGPDGWRWLDLSSGRMGPPGSRRIVVTGRLNDDQRIYEDILALIADGAPVAAVVDTLPALAAWRLPAIPFAVACTSGPGRHVTGHPAATDLLRAVLPDQEWLAGLGDDGDPHHGLVAQLGLSARSAGIRYGLATWVAARVWSRQHTADALVLATTNPDTSPASVVAERVRRVAGMARLVVEWAAQRDALVSADQVDPVTGVASRAAVLAALATALDRDQLEVEPVALVVGDLDGFTTANAALGQRDGDTALAEAVRRVAAAAEGDAVVGRLGSDEVAVVVRGPDARVAAEALARRAIEAMEAPLEVGGRSVRCGLSVGIAVSDGREHPPATEDQMLARAETALSLARTAGGGRSVTTTA